MAWITFKYYKTFLIFLAQVEDIYLEYHVYTFNLDLVRCQKYLSMETKPHFGYQFSIRLG